MANSQFDGLIQYLLRNLPGVLTDFVRINEETIARKTGLTVEKVISQLKKLDEFHFLSYAPRNDKPQILFLHEFVDTRHFNLSKENYHDRKKDAAERIKAVIAFVSNDDECRSVQLLRYFNEKTDKRCGRCDVCLKHGKSARSNGSYTQISSTLVSAAREGDFHISDAMKMCDGYSDEEILDAIRLLVDEGVLSLDKSGSLKSKK